VPRTKALLSVMVAFLAVNNRVLKSFPALFSVTSLPLVLIVVVPPTVTAPVWVKSPVVVMLKLLVRLEVPRTNALLSVMVAFLAVNNRLLKSFPALFSVTSLPLGIITTTWKCWSMLAWGLRWEMRP